MTALPVRLAHQLDVVAPEQRWLIEGLWGAEAVGIIGGEPKCCKSFLALDMAVAVASATPCLRRFPVARCGRVLLFAAEDALTTVRVRLEGICIATDLRLADLDLQVITAPTLRLDIELDRERLEDTVRALRPILLIFRSIRATAPRRRERVSRCGPAPGLPAWFAASLPDLRRPRASCTQRGQPSSRRSSPARKL